MSYEIEEKLKKMKPKPLTSEEKGSLWLKIESKLGYGGKTRFIKPVFGFLLNSGGRLAYAALAILIILGTSGAITIKAADAAKPGDFLFPVDLAAERVRVALASEEKKDELRVKFSEERLEETKLVLASVLVNIKVANDTHDASATSTTDNTSNATSSTSSAQNTATSSDNGTTTPPQNDDNDEEDEDLDPEKITRAQRALEIALEQLEKTRQTLESKGNAIALAAVERIIAELKALAEEHIAKLDKFEARIKDNGEKLKVEIKISNDELKAKFRLEQKNTDGDKGKNTDVRIKDTDSRTELKLKDSGLKLELKIKDQDKNKKDRNDDEHQDDDDEDENEDDDDDKNEKILVCHIPPGNPHRQRTIKVSEKSVDNHLKHGDHLGRCQENDDDEDDDNATSTPDTIAPVISGIGKNASTTSADISFSTNEPATSKVWYGTSTPLAITTSTLKATSLVSTTSHSFILSGLSASTTHYFIATATDSSGNTATSSEASFITLSE